MKEIKPKLSLDRFYILTSKNTAFNENEKAEMESFYSFFAGLYRNRDYLTKIPFDVLSLMINIFENLEFADKVFESKNILSRYNSIVEKVIETEKEKTSTRTLKPIPRTGSGYINAFIIISIVLNIGVFLGFILFMSVYS